MNKKLLARVLVFATVFALSAFAFAGCSPSGSSSSATEASEDSLIAYHEALGKDFSNVTEVSASTCTSEAACHDGSWDAVVKETEAMWEGVGQISDANPHDSHAASGYQCADCHSLEGTSVNQCNGCHNFDTPATWDEKDPATTVNGVATEEALS